MIKSTITFLSLVALSGTALGHGSKVETMDLATATALHTFKTDKAKESKSLSALKSWFSGSQVHVRIFHSANKENVLYKCEIVHHSDSEEMVCAVQN